MLVFSCFLFFYAEVKSGAAARTRAVSVFFFWLYLSAKITPTTNDKNKQKQTYKHTHTHKETCAGFSASLGRRMGVKLREDEQKPNMQ